MNAQGVCGFAHSLKELRPPDERDATYRGVWKDGVDRWYGQCMSEEQMERIAKYISKTAACDIPTWCHALQWYAYGAPDDDERYASYPDDFSITQNWECVSMYRKDERRPFYWAPDLWSRIERRRAAMLHREYMQSKVSPQGESSGEQLPEGKARAGVSTDDDASSDDTWY